MILALLGKQTSGIHTPILVRNKDWKELSAEQPENASKVNKLNQNRIINPLLGSLIF